MSGLWNKIVWLIKLYVALQKKSYPLVRYGSALLYKIPVLIGGANIVLRLMLPESYFINEFEINFAEIGGASFGFAGILMTVGIVLIIIGVRTSLKKARKTARVLIVSMLGESAHFPDNILFESEKSDAREPVKLGLIEGDNYNPRSVKMFNSEKMVDIYHRFILHHDCQKVFLGGRARVPFLVAYGSCFRNISAEIVYYDQIHLNGKWDLLNDEDQQVSLIYNDIESIQPNSNGEIGIALGFTTPIETHQLPATIQSNTLYIAPSTNPARNLIKNQDNLERISAEIKAIVDRLSSKENCRTIHLFLSVQVSMALEIGRNYQEGTHKNWVIHNFDAGQGRYTWAIKFVSNGMIEEY